MAKKTKNKVTKKPTSCVHGYHMSRKCVDCDRKHDAGEWKRLRGGKRTGPPKVHCTGTFECTTLDCDRSFTRRSHLAAHVMSKHTPKDQWVISCPGCEKKFAWTPAANAHIRGSGSNVKCAQLADDEREQAVVTVKKQVDDANQADSTTFVGEPMSF